MKLLLTGASGHIGANLLHRLLDAGQDVRVLLRGGSDNEGVKSLDVEKVWGDLRDPASVDAAVAGCQQVYHVGALVSTTAGREQEIFETNVLGTRNVLHAATRHEVQRVVVSGSFSAVGYVPGRPSTEEDPFNPFLAVMPYQFSKAGVEHECLKAAAEGLEVVVATSCAVLGPHDYKPSRMGRVLIDFANRRLRAYLPGGFEFVGAQDIVAGHLLAMEKGRSGQKYIFSSEFVTIDQLMGIYEKVTGQPRPRVRLPIPTMRVLAEVSSFFLTRYFPDVPQRFTPGAVKILAMRRQADISKARLELGYEPTPVADAVRQSYEHFVERGLIRRPERFGGADPTLRAAG